jgi:tRNA1(Val) A37 N6-methylase TrmN6
MLRVTRTQEDFGALGVFEIAQLEEQAFSEACESKQRAETDNTGLRVYSGTHVLLRVLQNVQIAALLCGRVCELGCGAGVLGLLATRLAPLQSVLLTDGSSQTLQLARMNLAL